MLLRYKSSWRCAVQISSPYVVYTNYTKIINNENDQTETILLGLLRTTFTETWEQSRGDRLAMSAPAYLSRFSSIWKHEPLLLVQFVPMSSTLQLRNAYLGLDLSLILRNSWHKILRLTSVRRMLSAGISVSGLSGEVWSLIFSCLEPLSHLILERSCRGLMHIGRGRDSWPQKIDLSQHASQVTNVVVRTIILFHFTCYTVANTIILPALLRPSFLRPSREKATPISHIERRFYFLIHNPALEEVRKPTGRGESFFCCSDR